MRPSAAKGPLQQTLKADPPGKVQPSDGVSVGEGNVSNQAVVAVADPALGIGASCLLYDSPHLVEGRRVPTEAVTNSSSSIAPSPSILPNCRAKVVLPEPVAL